MEKLAFGDCTTILMDKTFGLRRQAQIDTLTHWINLSKTITLSKRERENCMELRNLLNKNVFYWNEQDLALHFIGPMFSKVDFTEPYRFNLFAERLISSTVGNHELFGKPDELIATGYGEPEIPFFAFQEYKREKDPNGDPAGQVLAAMLVGQAKNNDDLPIYGSYVIGRDWYFMTLQKNHYAVSRDFSAVTDDVFDILRILKALKALIMERTAHLV
jgi:hypothetical protein